ncbi:MAG: WYL domain-containing protein [Nitrospira sp.]|nr:WYL domain-containing protein [Nitrospira sp.]
MSRNDQVIRQWHLLRLLESPTGVTLQELKARLPADYARHARTVRRDLEALEASGFPLINEQVGGQVRWRLMDGARQAPVLSFSPTELMALVMSRALLKPLAGTHIQAALDSAMAKASSLLPPASLDYAQQVHHLLAVGLGPHKTYKAHRETIDRLTHAIDKHLTVQVRYFSASRGRMTRREIDPYRLWYASGGLYLVGYCHLRKEPRLFAVERIRSVALTDHPYQMPLNFDLESFVQDALTVMRGPRIEVELLFDKATAAWVKDRIWHRSQVLNLLKDGRLRMTLSVADSRELVGWILSFGSGVRVIRPDSLKDAVFAEARKILAGE